MRINGIEIETIGSFAYDGCHKIYILEDYIDLKEAQQSNLYIYSIVDLERTYNRSCPLKFINNWKLDKTYAEQGEEAIFDEDDIDFMEIIDEDF